MVCAVFLALLQAATTATADQRAPDPGDTHEVVDDGEIEFDEIEAMKRQAKSEGDWAQSVSEQVDVDRRVFLKPWGEVPFGLHAFDYDDEQIRQQWPVLMRTLGVNYPSAEYLKAGIARFPQFRPEKFNGDYDALSREVVQQWRLFFRGDYQEAVRRGPALGFAGELPALVSQIMYAMYLETSLTDKHMLLQDAGNRFRGYGAAMGAAAIKDKRFQPDYIALRIGYSYSIGRIAEDVPVPVAIARNYIFKLLEAGNDVLDLKPDNPMGLTFRATLDANIVRKVGKATGRLTFGARPVAMNDYYKRALEIVPDAAIIRYEYANSMLYVRKKKEIEAALAQLKLGAAARPHSAMDALDSMYASKRSREIEALAAYSGSFRAFERKRLKFQKDANQNLYCVLPKGCPPFLVK